MTTGGKKILAIIGSNGMLATMVQQQAGAEWDLHPFDLPDFDVANVELVEKVLGALQPQVIINCAAFTNVDRCESEESLAMRVNGIGPGNLARVAKLIGAILVHISTDYVFDGTKTTPYCEEDAVAPCSVYGRTKLAGERAILDCGLETFFIVRTSWLYGPGGDNFVETIMSLAGEREELRIVADQVGTPTYSGDLARAIFSLLQLSSCRVPDSLREGYGIYHFSGEGQCSWYEFATEIVALARQRGETLKVQAIHPISTAEYPLPASRPAHSVFSKAKIKRMTGLDIPHWKASLITYLATRST